MVNSTLYHQSGHEKFPTVSLRFPYGSAAFSHVKFELPQNINKMQKQIVILEMRTRTLLTSRIGMYVDIHY